MSTFKHGLIAIPLTLAALAVVPAADNDTTPGVNPPGMTPHGGANTADQKRAINTIDPVNGRPVDSSVETLRVSSTGQAGQAGQAGAAGGVGATGAAGTVVIGFSEKSSRDKVEKAQGQEKQMYITAAQQNRVVKDGRIGDGKAGHDDKARRDGDRSHDDKARRDGVRDPAQSDGPNQRGDGLDQPQGANPGHTPGVETDATPGRDPGANPGATPRTTDPTPAR